MSGVCTELGPCRVEVERVIDQLSTGQCGKPSVQQIFLIPWIDPTPCSFPPLSGYFPYRLQQSAPLCINSNCQHEPARTVANAVSIGEAVCTYAESDIWSYLERTIIYHIILSEPANLCWMSLLHILLNPRISRPEVTVNVRRTLTVDSQE